MTRDDIRKLIGGYATDSLTEAERKLLFEAALEDQSLFDDLAREQSLKELLEEPGAKERLITQLAPRTKPVWSRAFPNRALPRLWLALAATTAAVVVAVVWLQQPAPKQLAEVRPAPVRATAPEPSNAPYPTAAPPPPSAVIDATPPALPPAGGGGARKRAANQTAPAPQGAAERDAAPLADQLSERRDIAAGRPEAAASPANVLAPSPAPSPAAAPPPPPPAAEKAAQKKVDAAPESERAAQPAPAAPPGPAAQSVVVTEGAAAPRSKGAVGGALTLARRFAFDYSVTPEGRLRVVPAADGFLTVGVRSGGATRPLFSSRPVRAGSVNDIDVPRDSALAVVIFSAQLTGPEGLNALGAQDAASGTKTDPNPSSNSRLMAIVPLSPAAR